MLWSKFGPVLSVGVGPCILDMEDRWVTHGGYSHFPVEVTANITPIAVRLKGADRVEGGTCIF